MGGYAVYGSEVSSSSLYLARLVCSTPFISGYEASCREIVDCRIKIQNAIETEIPELRILGKPVASVVAFAAAETPLGE